jgi:hypothetical protein
MQEFHIKIVHIFNAMNPKIKRHGPKPKNKRGIVDPW